MILGTLISAYEKEVFERQKWPVNHAEAIRVRDWERRLFARADMVVADTDAHADFFMRHLGVDSRKLKTLYVGAESFFLTLLET